MFTFALIHTLLLDWFIVPYPQEMDQIGEIVVCVNVCVCVLSICLDREEVVCSHAFRVALFSLFPLRLHLYIRLMHCNSSLSVCIYFFVELPNAIAKDVSG